MKDLGFLYPVREWFPGRWYFFLPGNGCHDVGPFKSLAEAIDARNKYARSDSVNDTVYTLFKGLGTIVFFVCLFAYIYWLVN